MIDFLGRIIECSCGKFHKTPTIDIICHNNLSERLADFFENALFIADENTFSLVNIPKENTFILKDSNRVMATMENVHKLLSFLEDKDYRHIVSIGSGTLTDIARYSAFISRKGFSCFPTAPSVDAYTSFVAPLLVEGVKKTLDAKVPEKILIDPEVLTDSPTDLLRAGLGDIAAKVTARLDWVLSNFLTGEDICNFVWDDIKDLLKEVMKDTKKVLQRDQSAIMKLMKTQLISGLNITIMGNSRPASGAEHLISHVFEMYQECRGKIPLFHGLQVAVGTYVTLKAYESLMQDIQFAKDKIPLEDKKKLLVDFFGMQIADEFQKIYLHKKRVEKVNIEDVKKSLETLYLQYHSVLQASLLDIGVKELLSKYDKNFIKNAIIVSTMTRDRYTILDLFDQHEILNDFCNWFIEQL